MTKVSEQPPNGSVERYEQMMRKTKGSVFPFAVGVIESIATDLHDSDAEKVRRICNALIACGRVAGLAFERFGEPATDPTGLLHSRDAEEDPTPTGTRVEPHNGAMTDGGLVDETEAPIVPSARRRALLFKRAVSSFGSLTAALEAAHGDALLEDNDRATAAVEAWMTPADAGRVANPNLAYFLAVLEDRRREPVRAE